MKPEELLYSLDHVGEDLLAQAEQTVLVRQRRPWRKAALAAVLALAVGVGGFALLRSRLPAETPTPGSDAPSVTMNEPQPAGLPMLAVGENWKGIFTRTQAEALRVRSDVWTGNPALTKLPVYQGNLIFTRDPAAGGMACCYGETQLWTMLRDAAALLGTSLPENVELLYDEAGERSPVGLQAQTDQGELSVYGDGRVWMLYDEAHRINATVKPQLSGELSAAETAAVLQRASMEDCAEKVRAILGLPECRLALWDYWNAASSAYHACFLYPARDDPAEQLTARYFECVRMMSADGRNVTGLEWYCSPDSKGAPARPEWMELVGNYPIISPQAAKEALLRGDCLCEVELDGSAAKADPGDPELVYLTENYHSLLLPFYRFMLQGDEFPILDESRGEIHSYTLLYVPAVSPDYLTDFPAGKTQPQAPDGPEETTAPPDGHEPVPVGEDEEGAAMIAGPAGAVKALQYMGGGCQSPVWADLDGDGQRELVYWCTGPTSGLFTVSICVYGLEEGWPVLEAAQLYNLNWGELRLTEENGQILLHYSSKRYDAETGSQVSRGEQTCAVTMQDGELLLNGGELPEGWQLWGGSEWNWFGRSFAWVQAFHGADDLLEDPSALVWEDEAGQVFAALSDNGVTVTGLLRWEPAANGAWFCSAWGVEPCRPAPADPAGLEQLSREELTEKLGPCHFSRNEGRILCWLTDSCKLLLVNCGGEQITVGQRELIPAPIECVPCFSPVGEANSGRFSNGETEIWLEDGAVMRKDLASGATETLFTLEPQAGIVTELVAVTGQRLYFGWNDAEVYEHVGGLMVYSVDYAGQDRRELTDYACDVLCQDGWIVLQTSRTDVGMVSLRIIDGNDKTRVELQNSWGAAVVDGSCYFIYAPSLEDPAAIEAMSDEERDALFSRMPYDVCLLDPDGNVKVIGTLPEPYYSACFRIDPETGTIQRGVGDDMQILDLFTLQPVEG